MRREREKETWDQILSWGRGQGLKHKVPQSRVYSVDNAGARVGLEEGSKVLHSSGLGAVDVEREQDWDQGASSELQ